MSRPYQQQGPTPGAAPEQGASAGPEAASQQHDDTVVDAEVEDVDDNGRK